MVSGVKPHVLSDAGLHIGFVSPGLVGKGLFCLDAGDNFGIVRAAGGQAKNSLGLMSNIPSTDPGKGLPCEFGLCPPKESRNDLRYGLVGKVPSHSRLP